MVTWNDRVCPRECTMAPNTALRAPRPTSPRGRAHDADRHVGMRMRERRIMLGLTQQQMAELIGVTYQQAHKYEKGINRIAAGRLYTIAQALGVEVSSSSTAWRDRAAVEPTPSSGCCSSSPATSSHPEPPAPGGDLQPRPRAGQSGRRACERRLTCTCHCRSRCLRLLVRLPQVAMSHQRRELFLVWSRNSQPQP